MTGDLLTNLTLVTNFLCMAISLWFAIYLLARSPANPFTFRAVVALLAVAFYYNSAFTDMVNFSAASNPVRSFSTIIALIAAHDLTHYLLPPAQRKKLYWVARGIVIMGVITIVLLFIAAPTEDCDPRFTCPANFFYPWTIIDSFKVLCFLAILNNLWLIKKSEAHLQNVAFYAAMLVGSSTIAYSLVSTALNLDLPRFLPNTAMLFALALLLYSVARDRTLVTRRSPPYELLITMLTIVVIVALYVLSASQMGLGPTGILLLAVLAITTHSAYDFVRELIDRTFRLQEGRMRQELRQIARETTTGDALPRFLKRGLAILCHNLNATYGLIALRQQDRYRVVASLHCLPVGSHFPAREIFSEEDPGASVPLMGYQLWVVPAFVGLELVAIVGVGNRRDSLPYSEEDIYWLEDIAEEIGWLISAYWKRRSEAVEAPAEAVDVSIDAFTGYDTDELLTKLAYKPDPELIKNVEEGLRNLNDYSKLGKSPLVAIFGIRAQDHIESGKLVQRKLTEIIEKLRPAGETPHEPLPREWYAYTILHDAYVENRLARDIMSKLYISEGTYYRMRRHALRGVTRAMLETGTVV